MRVYIYKYVFIYKCIYLNKYDENLIVALANKGQAREISEIELGNKCTRARTTHTHSLFNINAITRVHAQSHMLTTLNRILSLAHANTSTNERTHTNTDYSLQVVSQVQAYAL